MRTHRFRLPILLLLLLLGSAPVVGGQPAEPSGFQFVADNATAAATAAAIAPLSPVGLNGVDGAATGKSVNLPAGFSIVQVASGLKNPRFMTFDDAGNLLVADAGRGAVYRYAAGGGSIAPSGQPPAPLVSGLEAPSNVVVHNGYLYIGETRTISRYAYDPNAAAGGREAIVSDLPTGGHSTRTVQFDAAGAMYVSVGSSCNICDESDQRRAAILRFADDGSGQQVFARGLRNAVGLAIQPGSGLLWATVNERDNQGNEIPPDLVTIVAEGQNFGWPGCQPPNATPQDAGRDCSAITPPTVGLQAHGAPLGLAFSTGQQFPGDYANDLFVIQHGSWNRQPPAEPKVVRLHFDGLRPVSAQDFATGWQMADGSRWGRPAGVVVAPDGSLIISDDQAGTLYRIAYSG
ncbi:MAG TPA: PQQ-dependent sugar dehydrogenase [Chloroflexota bacterium]|jgi:glucose/arabinose dehydrogenase|nr:PQQ-dependent sugar dehydrogenase [Chloroflexota bacterium]